VPPDQAGVPAQQDARGDDQARLAELAARKQPGQRGQNRPVGPRQPRGLDLALEDGDLVRQDEDIGVSPVYSNKPGRCAVRWEAAPRESVAWDARVIDHDPAPSACRPM
jgi:hypothetical protein